MNLFCFWLEKASHRSDGAVGNPKTCVQPKEQLLKKANEVPSEAKTTSRASQTSQKRCLCLGNLTASRGEPARCE